MQRSAWWVPGLAFAAVAAALFALAATPALAPGRVAVGGAAWWALTLTLHLPLLLILIFLAGGLIERLGFYWRGRAPERPGRMPAMPPTVCVQLPMFNEHAVARRAIDAACALGWPADRLSVQVLDDSTDEDTRARSSTGPAPRRGRAPGSTAACAAAPAARVTRPARSRPAGARPAPS